MTVQFLGWLRGFFADYQVWATLIAALAGFGGIILTLVIQRHNDLTLEIAKEDRERERFIAALCTELADVVRYAETALRHISPNESFLLPKQMPFYAFASLRSKIDLLTPEQIRAVIKCYSWMEVIGARGSLLSRSPGATADHTTIPAELTHVIKEWFEMQVSLAEIALRKLSSKEA
ncbi:MAG: hypothetical protein AB7M12_05260 [Hyphomonadaceae bacterium]